MIAMDLDESATDTGIGTGSLAKLSPSLNPMPNPESKPETERFVARGQQGGHFLARVSLAASP